MSIDVALVRFSTTRASIRATAQSPYSPCARFDTDSNWERPGEKVYVFGNPEGLEWSFTDGLLSSERAQGAIFQISAPAGHGSSGSPVFNEYGLVIGMIQGGIDQTTAGIAFAVSTDAIFEALGLTNNEHPKGFNLGITNGLELRSKEDIAADTAQTTQVSNVQTTPVNEKLQEAALGHIIANIRIYSTDKAAFDKWAADIRRFAPWDINRDYWVGEMGRQSGNPYYIADVNRLLQLQEREPLPEIAPAAQVVASAKPSDDEIRAEKEKAIEARKLEGARQLEADAQRQKEIDQQFVKEAQEATKRHNNELIRGAPNVSD